MSRIASGRGWAVVVPVKPAAVGKSRLDVAGVDRVRLARAIALDTIAAAAACSAVEHVYVVTDDGALVTLASGIPGLRFVPESDVAGSGLAEPDAAGAGPAGRPPARGIDAAVARAAAAAGERMPRAALLGDLPALRPEDLQVALELAATAERAVVSDEEGTGTTLVTAGRGIPLLTSFGDGSFARHLELGCVPLPVPDASTLRRDVDTAAHLEIAAGLGLGPRTMRALSTRARTTSDEHAVRRAGRPRPRS